MAKRIEDGIQVKMVKGLRKALPPSAVIAFIPNGVGAFSKHLGAKYKAMGLMAGMPDLMIMHITGVYFIEVKRPKGTTNPNQKAMHKWMVANGYQVGVATSTEEAIELVKGWNLCRSTDGGVLYEPPAIKGKKGDIWHDKIPF